MIAVMIILLTLMTREYLPLPFFLVMLIGGVAMLGLPYLTLRVRRPYTSGYIDYDRDDDL